MGFYNSKAFKILKQDGIVKSLNYFFRKHEILSIFNQLLIPFLIYIYPKIILDRKQHVSFIALRRKFIDNYKRIVSIDPMFFKNNLKKHVEWLESDIFKQEYIELVKKYNV